MESSDGSAEAKARRTLVQTLCKIGHLDPMLGGKWRRGMLRYYSQRLAELLLSEGGTPEPAAPEIERLGERILELLESGDLDGI